MSYADYEFYKEVYRGMTVSEDDFAHYELKACAQLDSFLCCKPDEATMCDEIKFAVCEICDILCEADSHSGIEYERNDGYWVSYEEGLTAKDRIKSCIFTWLKGSGLLYRGRDS